MVWIGLPVGALLVAYAYAYAATVFAGHTHFHLFWLGVLMFMAPACARLCAGPAPRAERLAIVAAVGLFDALPKFLRNPQMPLFHDELAHWRQSELVYETGRLFLPNPSVYISQYFPGLHALTAALRDLSGLSTFGIGVILVAASHVAALLGIFVIAERVTRSAHAAGIAAAIYSLNPSFMFFDAEYAYESLAIVLFIWVIAATVSMQDARGDPARRAAWFAAGLVLAGGCIVTHHLSSYVMVLALWVLSAITRLRARRNPEARREAGPVLVFTAIVSTATAAWLFLVAPAVLPYLGTPIADGLAQLGRLLRHQQTARTLFANSATPLYERASAFASPVIALAGAACGLWRLRREPRRPSAGIALALFGLLYFLSLPVMLTGAAANEGARRSWAFSYVGLAVLVAPAIVWLSRWAAARGVATGGAARISVVALLSVVLVGNVSMHVNELYRFPGPYVYGSDTRSITAELLGAEAWFRATQGTGRRVVADRYTGLAFSSFGLDWTAEAAGDLPVWQLYFRRSWPDADLLDKLRRQGYRYLIVDTRMARYLPYLGVYFQRDEPDAVVRTTPPPMAGLLKYERAPWAVKIYQSDNLAIYRFEWPALHITWPAFAMATSCATETRRHGETKEPSPCLRVSVVNGRSHAVVMRRSA